MAQFTHNMEIDAGKAFGVSTLTPLLTGLSVKQKILQSYQIALRMLRYKG